MPEPSKVVENTSSHRRESFYESQLHLTFQNRETNEELKLNKPKHSFSSLPSAESGISPLVFHVLQSAVSCPGASPLSILAAWFSWLEQAALGGSGDIWGHKVCSVPDGSVLCLSQCCPCAAWEEWADGRLCRDALTSSTHSWCQPQQQALRLFLSPVFIDHSSISGS